MNGVGFELNIKTKEEIDPATYSPKFLLHRHLVREETARSYTKVHASDLMGRKEFCPREYALGLKYLNPRDDERIATAEAVTFEYGYAVESLVRKWFSQMDRAHGNWECLACSKTYEFQRRPFKCSCGSKAFDYKEITFTHGSSGVTCRPDLFLDFGRPKLTVLEIKSIDKEEIKKLAAPLAEHRWRTNLYMRIIDQSDSPHRDLIDTQDAFVLYVTKGGYGFKDEQLKKWKLNDSDFSPFREFPVVRDDSQTDELLARAAMVREYRKTGVMPLGVCPTMLCQRAKWCKQAKHCWSEHEVQS
jgi:hypothetical protein